MKNHTKLGFTLVELIITITVIGILSTVAFFGVGGLLASTRDKTHADNIRAISAALEDYYRDNGEYPLGSELNTNNSITEISASDLNTVKTLMPELNDSNLNGPSGYKFFAYCTYTSPGPCPSDTTSNWETYHSKQYIYLSTYAAATDPQVTQIAASFGNNTGWGCQITRYYDANQSDGSIQGYALAYRRETDGKWVFYKSRKGTVTITNYSSPNPSTCDATEL